jgi:hypothetical protein
MKTLTITEAKKNLGKWINAAARGQEIAILSGENVVALRKVEVEANDYAWREYGATPEELENFVRRVNAEVAKLEREKRLIPVPEKMEEAFEKIAGLKPRRAKTASRAARR